MQLLTRYPNSQERQNLGRHTTNPVGGLTSLVPHDELEILNQIFVCADSGEDDVR